MARSHHGPEDQRACKHCDHSRASHLHHREEGACTVYSCGCRKYEASDLYIEREYSGDPMPAWVVEGARVKVKRTPTTKEYGLTVYGGAKADSKAWPGDIGAIERVDGEGWWTWRVAFPRGRGMRLNTDDLENLIKVRR